MTAAIRRDRIEAQVGLGNALVDLKGHADPETKSAFRRARDLMKQADELDEIPDDSVVRFSVLIGLWRAAYVAFDGELMRELAAECLVRAEKQGATVLLSIAHRLLGMTLELTGKFAAARAHQDQALAHFDPAKQRPLAPRFGPDVRVSTLAFRALNLWLLGYPRAAQADIDDAVKEAREIGQAANLMLALAISNYTHIVCGNDAAANALAEELVVLADEKGALLRKAEGVFQQGCVLALTGKDAEAVQMITSGMTAWRATGATCWAPLQLSFLANAYARLGQFDDAQRCIVEAMAASEATGESWCDADIQRLAGDIVVLSGEPDMAKAEAYFERALTVARGQQAKSFELRAASALARLWRDQGKCGEARDLLARVYGWFTEGFDTHDLRHAKKLLDELVS
jgi:predicted ATPase